MKRYYVTVNGHRYQVEVEEVKGDFEASSNYTPIAEVTVPKAEPQPAKPQSTEAVSEAPKKAPKSTPTGGEKINCPMPGTIVSVNIKEGQRINKGDLLFVLEAMKMENEIVSPFEGTVASVEVSKGQSVNTEDLLAVIE